MSNKARQIIRTVDRSNARIAKQVIKGYQLTLSPDTGLPSTILKGTVCSHTPSCSNYAIQHLDRFGLNDSIIPIIQRIYKCRPAMNKTYDPPFYKVVFRCSAPIGISFLDELSKVPHTQVVGIVTQPDQPSGRGMKVQPNIIKSHAIQLGFDEHIIKTPHKIRPNKSEEGKEFYEWLQTLDADYFVVIAYGKIIPQEILDIAKIAPINVHGSILPAYRGASPLQSVFLDNKHNTGITIMKMDAGLDTGDIISIQHIGLGFNDTVEQLIQSIKNTTPQFLTKTLIKFAKGELISYPQGEVGVSHTKQFTKEDGLIRLSDNLKEVYAKYRAFAMWPKIWYNNEEGKRIIIEKILLDQDLYAIHQSEALQENGIRNPAVISISTKLEGKNTITREKK